MDIRQCRRCGKLFQYRGKYECPVCIQKIDESYTRVRRYLFEHPGANINDICETCEVEEDDVLAWTREGRLILGSDSSVVCEKCGKTISSGRYCSACSQQLSSTLEDAKKSMEKSAAEAADRKRDGMRMNKDKDK